MEKFQNLKYSLQYQVIRQKMCANKKCAKFINYRFLKSHYNGKFKYAKIFAKFSKTKFVFKEI